MRSTRGPAKRVGTHDTIRLALEAFGYPPGKEGKDWCKYQKRLEKQQKREEKLERKKLTREEELQERGH